MFIRKCKGDCVNETDAPVKACVLNSVVQRTRLLHAEGVV